MTSFQNPAERPKAKGMSQGYLNKMSSSSFLIPTPLATV